MHYKHPFNVGIISPIPSLSFFCGHSKPGHEQGHPHDEKASFLLSYDHMRSMTSQSLSPNPSHLDRPYIICTKRHNVLFKLCPYTSFHISFIKNKSLPGMKLCAHKKKSGQTQLYFFPKYQNPFFNNIKKAATWISSRMEHAITY